VEAGSLSVFKTEIDKFLIARGIKGYGGESGRMELKNLSAMIEWWSGLAGPEWPYCRFCVSRSYYDLGGDAYAGFYGLIVR